MIKTTEQYFRDWESHVFGFGYGSGEEHTIPALKLFFELCKPNNSKGYSYDYEELEKHLTPAVAWLLINILCHAGTIDYGSSPRFAWLEHKSGNLLREFIASHTVDELVGFTQFDEGYGCCGPKHCNCGNLSEPNDGGGYVEGQLCPNPFFGVSRE